MDCSFCGPGVKIKKGRGSCPICHETVYKIYDYAINGKLNKAMNSKGIVEKHNGTASKPMFAWAKGQVPELYADMKSLEEEAYKMFYEGEDALAGNRFDAAHFDGFCQALRLYGNGANKIFVAYLKADIELVEEDYVPEWERPATPPAQAEMAV